MSELTTNVENFFEPLLDDDEGRETVEKQLRPRTFAFDVADDDSFVLRTDADGVKCTPGEPESDDLVNDVTRVEVDTDTLHRMMGGRVSPLDALNDGDLFMTSMMTARCYNYGLLRAFRRGAELAGCQNYEWEG